MPGLRPQEGGVDVMLRELERGDDEVFAGVIADVTLVEVGPAVGLRGRKRRCVTLGMNTQAWRYSIAVHHIIPPCQDKEVVRIVMLQQHDDNPLIPDTSHVCSLCYSCPGETRCQRCGSCPI